MGEIIKRRRTIIRNVPVTREAMALYIGEIVEVRSESGQRVRVAPLDPEELDQLDARGAGFQNFWASSDVDGQHIRPGMLQPHVHGDAWRDFLFCGFAPTWTKGDHLWAERT